MSGKLRPTENAFYRRLQRRMTWISELKSDSAAMKGYHRTLSNQSAGYLLIHHARGHNREAQNENDKMNRPNKDRHGEEGHLGCSQTHPPCFVHETLMAVILSSIVL